MRAGGGERAVSRRGDRVQNATEAPVFENVGGDKTQNANAAFREPSVASLVMGDAVGEAVRGPIDFDGQTSVRAEEVEHVRADRVLPAEPQSTKLAAS